MTDPVYRERLAIITFGGATDSSRQAKRTAPLLGILSIAAAFSLGARYEWQMNAWTQGGTRTAPRWVIFPAALMTGAALITAAIVYVRAKSRELREAIARVENSES